MFRKKFAYALPVVVLLSLSLVTTASTGGNRVKAQSEEQPQHLTVFIHDLQSQHQKTVLAGDKIEWYEGAEADRKFAEREPEAAAEIGGVPDSYYIVNDDETLAAYPVAEDASVYMQIYDHTGQIEDLDIHWNEQISLKEFEEQFHNTNILDLGAFPYHLTIQDGEITSIVQQYTP